MSRVTDRYVCLLFVLLVATSCANSAKHLRAQPAWFMEPDNNNNKNPLTVSLPRLDDSGAPIAPEVPVVIVSSARPVATVASLTGFAPASLPLPPGEIAKPSKSVAADADTTVELKCVRTPRESENRSASEMNPIPQCLYMSIDMRDVLKVPIRNRAERNRLVHLLVNVSDYNCSTFLMRAFANKAGADATRNTAKDIATAIAAGTAKVAGGFSLGIGLFNLVGGAAIDNFNQSYYSDKTFQVMAAAIGAERDRARETIISRSRNDLADYSYLEALEDVHVYDDSCSLRRGLESLAELANKEKASAEHDLNESRKGSRERASADLETARLQRDQLFSQMLQLQESVRAAKSDAERKTFVDQVNALMKQIDTSNAEIAKLRNELKKNESGAIAAAADAGTKAEDANKKDPPTPEQP